MNNKITFIGVGVLVAIIVSIAIALIPTLDKGDRKANLNLYFLNEKKTSIVAENKEFKYQDSSKLPQMLLEKLIKGPKDIKNSKIMSTKTKVLSIDTSTSNIIVDFSNEYLSGDMSQDILTTYAVVKSLCEISGVDSVKITVEKKDIISPDGSAIGFLSSSDINLPTDDTNTSIHNLVVYFASKDSYTLVRETHKVKIIDKQPIEKYIINELINGPISKELEPVLSPNTSLISVETKDKICYVNLKADFLEKNAMSKEKELLALYSIVNSLTELDTVNQVQFLIDGKKATDFGYIPISELYSRNDMVISK